MCAIIYISIRSMSCVQWAGIKFVVALTIKQTADIIQMNFKIALFFSSLFSIVKITIALMVAPKIAAATAVVAQTVAIVLVTMSIPNRQRQQQQQLQYWMQKIQLLKSMRRNAIDDVPDRYATHSVGCALKYSPC